MNNPGEGPEAFATFDARFLTPRDLAGEHFKQMQTSKEATTPFLRALNHRTRLGAILICEQIWHAGSEPGVLESCRSLADSNADDSIRMVALDLIGRALIATKDPTATRFVARMVLDPHSAAPLRTHAYWVLREIAYGVVDADFDSFLRGTIHTVKAILKARPSQFSENAVKSALLPEGSFPNDFWESSDQIDWEFVHRMLRR